MARADLLVDAIKFGLSHDTVNFRKAAEAICAEERAKQHGVLAGKIEGLLRDANRSAYNVVNGAREASQNGIHGVLAERTPTRRFDSLVIPPNVEKSLHEVIEEQARADLLRSHGVEPRNRILLIGPPGNGKTSLAEAVAEALVVPMFVVQYEGIIGAYLGETATKLARLFDFIRTRQCVLFFDEFETIGKERGDTHETGEIKRVVSSLLLQIDALPTHVVAIAATNHDALLDNAAWRRFQLRLRLPMPTKANLERWIALWEKRMGFSLGYTASTLAKRLYGRSFSEVEEFVLSVYRRYVLCLPSGDPKEITRDQLKLFLDQANASTKSSFENADQ